LTRYSLFNRTRKQDQQCNKKDIIIMPEYRWEVVPCSEETVHRIQDQVGVSRPIALALASRGITASQAELYLRPSLSSLTDPFDLPGARAAAERLWQAVQNDETILIHGDYDTDGITSAVLVADVLNRNGARTETFLPHRIDDGYGLTPESIEKACESHHSLLVTVDCGITSLSAVESALAQGIDVIVTDHHEPGAELPRATAVIDPKLPGASPAVQELAGVGVAFKLCHAFIKYGREQGLGGFSENLRDILDLVALGTVADIVPLRDENRALVKAGLNELSRQHRPGVRALCEIAGLNSSVRAPDIAFRLAPRLNASGRMGDPMLSMRLLQTASMRDALPMARSLDEQNRDRQQMESTTIEEAEAQIAEKYDLRQNRTLVVWSQQWHQGVVGIVASRLARGYHRPSVVLTADAGGALCGSGRSISQVNLVEALAECRQWLTRYGGHPMAAGLSLEPANVESFAQAFEAVVSRDLAIDDMQPRLEIAGEIQLEEITDQFLTEIELLEPFGQGNPEPVFLSRNVQAVGVREVGRGHTRGTLLDQYTGCSINFIAFGRPPESFPTGTWDAVYRARINTYNGVSSPQAQIMDARAAGPNF
jgi:single-stranded-DNA-specific exonuclease